MLQLMLLRHAKAVARDPGGDFERGLSDRGRRDATMIAQELAGHNHQIGLALVSAAKRTSQTFEILQSGLQDLVPARFEHRLYNATATQIIDMVGAVGGEIASVLVVGHNPGIGEAAAALAGQGDDRDLRRLEDGYPTCTLAIITFRCTQWRDIEFSEGRLDALIVPRDQ